jgi:hypothetical protein
MMLMRVWRSYLAINDFSRLVVYVYVCACIFELLNLLFGVDLFLTRNSREFYVSRVVRHVLEPDRIVSLNKEKKRHK